MKRYLRHFAAAITCLFCLALSANAQMLGGPAGLSAPPSNPIGGVSALGQSYNNNTFGATFDPGGFDHNMQFFAPLDVSDYSGGPKAKSGFFASYDRTYMSFSRPGKTVTNTGPGVPTGSDWVSGARYTLGNTNELGNGWQIKFQHMSGSFFSAGANEFISQPAMTTASLHDFEIRRTFRTDLSRGGYFEPYISANYLNLSDNHRQDGLFEIRDNQGTPDPDDDIFVNADHIFQTNATNSAFGARIGMNYFNQAGRLSTMTSVALAGMYNNQRIQVNNTSIVGATFTANQSAASSSSFLPALELGLSGTYGITKNISLRLGGQVLYLWDGVNRTETLSISESSLVSLGATNVAPVISSQDAVIAGLNFGIEFRR